MLVLNHLIMQRLLLLDGEGTGEALCVRLIDGDT